MRKVKGLFTTKNDLSAGIFEKHGWDVWFYEDKAWPEKEYQYIYLRDPFNVENGKEFAGAIDEILEEYAAARSIDGVKSFSEMEKIEDKWEQAERYAEFMPKTFLATEVEFVSGEHLAKPRISQRAKDILFELDREIDDNWIVQELMEIEEELRVYVVFGKVVPEATIKSSKRSGKVKVIGGRKLDPKEIAFCEQIAQKSGLDFIGIDLAKLENGEMKCIEVNRSPQFVRFVERYGEEPLSAILDL